MSEDNNLSEKKARGEKNSRLHRLVIFGIITGIILYLQYFMFFIKGYTFKGTIIPGLYFVLFIPLLHILIATSIETDLIISVVIVFLSYWLTAFFLGFTGEQNLTETQLMFFKGVLISPVFYSIAVSIYFLIPQQYR